MRHLAPMEIDPRIRQHIRPVRYGHGAALRGRVFEIPGWNGWSIERQVAFIRQWTETTSRDPHIARLAVRIFREAGVNARDYPGQWAAILRWARKHIYYVNEKNERLQSPQYTITSGHGDCDDMAISVLGLGESVRLPWRIVLSGTTQRGQKVRWIEGSGPVPAGVTWTHIYGLAGWPPFRPTQWAFMEPTLPVPFGWDVIQGQRERAQGRGRRGTTLPELGRPTSRTGRRFGDPAPVAPAQAASPAPTTLTVPAAALYRPVRFVVTLPWAQIIAAALPTVISAWWITRFIQGRGEHARTCRA